MRPRSAIRPRTNVQKAVRSLSVHSLTLYSTSNLGTTVAWASSTRSAYGAQLSHRVCGVCAVWSARRSTARGHGPVSAWCHCALLTRDENDRFVGEYDGATWRGYSRSSASALVATIWTTSGLSRSRRQRLSSKSATPTSGCWHASAVCTRSRWGGTGSRHRRPLPHIWRTLTCGVRIRTSINAVASISASGYSNHTPAIQRGIGTKANAPMPRQDVSGSTWEWWTVASGWRARPGACTDANPALSGSGEACRENQTRRRW